MSEGKLLTIAIPTYCRAGYLRKAIKSISSQYDERIEVLVSDNASPDSTPEVVKEAQLVIPINYIRNELNLGFDANILQCFRKAEGKYVLLLGDDDLIVSGKLKTILDFLSTSATYDLVFLNYGFFYENKDCDDIYVHGFFGHDTGNKTNASKAELLNYAKHRLTYISCLIFSKSDIDRIDHPERFIGTCFAHSCVAATITSNSDSKIGIITCPCVLQRMITDEEERPGLKNEVRTFGSSMHYLYCDLMPQCGYDANKTRQIYKKFIYRTFQTKILRLKAYGDTEWKSEFWRYGYPNIKSFPSAWLLVMPVLLIPKFLAKWIVFKIRPIYKKRKGYSISA